MSRIFRLLRRAPIREVLPVVAIDLDGPSVEVVHLHELGRRRVLLEITTPDGGVAIDVRLLDFQCEALVDAVSEAMLWAYGSAPS